MSFPDYPFERNFFDRGGGIRMHYVDEGPRDAPPVVMVHGNPTWSFYYRRVINALKTTHRCIVPDHIGMGLSDKPTDEQYVHTLESRVDDLSALLNHLEVTGDVDLIVHDWGGMIGSAFAVRNPERIRRMVVLNTGAFHLPKTKMLPWQLKLCRSFLGAIAVRGFNQFCRGGVRQCVTRKMKADVRRAYLHPYNSWANRRAVLRFVEDIPLTPTEDSYALVNEVDEKLEELSHVPKLICWGMKDFVFDEHFLTEWVARFPKADVHRFNDAGHYVLEDAHEAILPLIERFLGSEKGESASCY